MKYDDYKIEEVVLALLGAFEFENGRAWKRYDFEVMDALHSKGFIAEPRGKRESVHLTAEGLVVAKQLAAKYFGVAGEPNAV